MEIALKNLVANRSAALVASNDTCSYISLENLKGDDRGVEIDEFVWSLDEKFGDEEESNDSIVFQIITKDSDEPIYVLIDDLTNVVSKKKQKTVIEIYAYIVNEHLKPNRKSRCLMEKDIERLQKFFVKSRKGLKKLATPKAAVPPPHEIMYPPELTPLEGYADYIKQVYVPNADMNDIINYIPRGTYVEMFGKSDRGFSLATLQRAYELGNYAYVVCYISTYFVRAKTSAGAQAFAEYVPTSEDKIRLLTTKDLEETVFNNGIYPGGVAPGSKNSDSPGFNVVFWFMKANSTICEYGCDPTKETFFVESNTLHLNVFRRPIKHEKKEWSKDTLEKVDKVWHHLRDVLCSGDIEMYNYVRRWFSWIATCKRTKSSCVVFAGPQGAGKSIFTEFIARKVLGGNLTIFSDDPSAVVKTEFNDFLVGVSLVHLSEPNTASTDKWLSACQGLKAIISDPKIVINGKHIKKFSIKNQISVVILTNSPYGFVQIEDKHRRYVYPEVRNLPLNKKANDDYFKQLVAITEDPDVASAFYWQCVDISQEPFNPETDMPESRIKNELLSANLPPIVEFIKKEYYLKRKGIADDGDDLFSTFCEKYKDWAQRNGVRLKRNEDSNSAIGRILDHHGFDKKGCPKRTHARFYKTWNELDALYKSKGWYNDEFDEFADGIVESDGLDNMSHSDLVKEIRKLRKMIKDSAATQRTPKAVIEKSSETSSSDEEIPPPQAIKPDVDMAEVIQSAATKFVDESSSDEEIPPPREIKSSTKSLPRKNELTESSSDDKPKKKELPAKRLMIDDDSDSFVEVSDCDVIDVPSESDEYEDSSSIEVENFDEMIDMC